MIEAVGIDLIEIDRFADVLSRWGERLTSRLFTAKELELCRDKASGVQSLAARFAAKEAFSKAVGLGWAGGLRWQDIEILSESTGQPLIRLHGRAERMLRGKKLFVSLSHTQANAIAIVLIESA